MILAFCFQNILLSRSFKPLVTKERSSVLHLFLRVLDLGITHGGSRTSSYLSLNYYHFMSCVPSSVTSIWENVT
jgi:hypothetical protein